MAKRRSYEEILLDRLMQLELHKWFRIDNHKDYEKITASVKKLIDQCEPFEFSTDYSRIRRIRDYFDFK